MTTFYEMVCTECNVLDERDQLDAIILRKIVKFLDDDKSRRDGQTVGVNKGVGTVAYKGVVVAEFSVSNNSCSYRSPGSNWRGPIESNSDWRDPIESEEAIMELARIVAVGIRHAQRDQERAA
jgi:hypothetical protein